jgi:hypothetical protein
MYRCRSNNSRKRCKLDRLSGSQPGPDTHGYITGRAVSPATSTVANHGSDEYQALHSETIYSPPGMQFQELYPLDSSSFTSIEHTLNHPLASSKASVEYGTSLEALGEEGPMCQTQLRLYNTYSNYYGNNSSGIFDQDGVSNIDPQILEWYCINAPPWGAAQYLSPYLLPASSPTSYLFKQFNDSSTSDIHYYPTGEINPN